MESFENKTEAMTETEEKELLRSEEITQEVIRYVVEKIARTLDPEKVIVFGSAVTGHTNEANDLDVLVVMDSEEPPRTRRKAVSRLFWGRLFNFDPHVITPKELEKAIQTENDFVEDILETGQILYERKPA